MRMKKKKDYIQSTRLKHPQISRGSVLKNCILEGITAEQTDLVQEQSVLAAEATSIVSGSADKFNPRKESDWFATVAPLHLCERHGKTWVRCGSTVASPLSMFPLFNYPVCGGTFGAKNNCVSSWNEQTLTAPLIATESSKPAGTSTFFFCKPISWSNQWQKECD